MDCRSIDQALSLSSAPCLQPLAPSSHRFHDNDLFHANHRVSVHACLRSSGRSPSRRCCCSPLAACCAALARCTQIGTVGRLVLTVGGRGFSKLTWVKMRDAEQIRVSQNASSGARGRRDDEARSAHSIAVAVESDTALFSVCKGTTQRNVAVSRNALVDLKHILEAVACP